jgi:PAS domain S-box-containing protein
MSEIVKINLDNEMDLILAHKRTMKLAEMCGLSLSAQTTFATAVSEIARAAITVGEKSHMVLTVAPLRLNKKELVATIFDSVDLSIANPDAFNYAKKLISHVEVHPQNGHFEVQLKHHINFSGTMSADKINNFKEYFLTEPPISPYDEIRKKNLQLIDLANKLKESEKQYKVLTDTLPLMMFALNDKGEMNYSNKWLKDFFAANPGMPPLAWHSNLHEEDRLRLMKEWKKVEVEKSTFRGEGRMKDHTGKYVWHLLTIVPLKQENNVKTNWIGFFVDIDSQKLVEATLKDNRALIAAQEELEKNQMALEQKIQELFLSNKNLEEFAFIASHDLQEPLRKIRTYSNLIEKDLPLDEKNAMYFGKIKKASERMTVLIGDVLNYSQLSGNKMKLVKSDLNGILGHVLDDLEILVNDRKAQVLVPEPLPELEVQPQQISQLFSNLLQNSIKFCGTEPLIKITWKRTGWDHNKKFPQLDPFTEYVQIQFEDNGVGFDAQYAEKIFVIFQRLNEVESSGTGIGLALCRKIVDNHKGYIMAESNHHKGATFTVYLPDGSARKLAQDIQAQ